MKKRSSTFGMLLLISLEGDRSILLLFFFFLKQADKLDSVSQTARMTPKARFARFFFSFPALVQTECVENVPAAGFPSISRLHCQMQSCRWTNTWRQTPNVTRYTLLAFDPDHCLAGRDGADRSPCRGQALASSSSRNSLCIGTRPSCLMLQKCWTARAAV